MWRTRAEVSTIYCASVQAYQHFLAHLLRDTFIVRLFRNRRSLLRICPGISTLYCASGQERQHYTFCVSSELSTLYCAPAQEYQYFIVHLIRSQEYQRCNVRLFMRINIVLQILSEYRRIIAHLFRNALLCICAGTSAMS